MLALCFQATPRDVRAWRLFLADARPGKVVAFVIRRGRKKVVPWCIGVKGTTNTMVREALKRRVAKIAVLNAKASPSLYPDLLLARHDIGMSRAFAKRLLGQQYDISPMVSAVYHGAWAARNRILFTMCVDLKEEEREEAWQLAMANILRIEPSIEAYCDFLFVNEPSDSPVTSERIITKKKGQEGVARSLNYIVHELHKGQYEFWIHWDERYYAHKSFLVPMLEAQRRGIDHFSIVEESVNVDPTCRVALPVQGKTLQIAPRPDLKGYRKLRRASCAKRLSNNLDPAVRWGSSRRLPRGAQELIMETLPPLLFPGMHRVTNVLKTGYFDTSLENCETEWTYNWFTEKPEPRCAGLELCRIHPDWT